MSAAPSPSPVSPPTVSPDAPTPYTQPRAVCDMSNADLRAWARARSGVSPDATRHTQWPHRAAGPDAVEVDVSRRFLP